MNMYIDYIYSVAIVAMTANQTHTEENGTIAVVGLALFSNCAEYFTSNFISISKMLPCLITRQDIHFIFSTQILHGTPTPKVSS